MIPVPDFAGLAVAVHGLGERGLAAALALRAGGARPLVWDDREGARARAESEGLETADLRARDWGDLAALVLTPGGPGGSEARVLELAQLTRTPILGDVELFGRALAARPEEERGRVVAVAGARGKSTVAALIAHVLAAGGRDAHLGGGAGAAPLALPPPHPGAIYLLELHARDLVLAPGLEAEIVLFLNADEPRSRDADAAAEAAALARVQEAVARGRHAVVGVDDPFGRGLATELRARQVGPRVTAVSAGRALSRGVHAVGGVLFDALDGPAQEALDLRRAPALLGPPNWRNAAAAFAACRILGLEPGAAARHMTSWPGLPHRLELVAERGPVRFVDDSYASDPATARHALAAFEDVHWIAGGRSKGAGLAALEPVASHVAKAYLIGEAAEIIAAELRGRMVAEICRDLETAVRRAAADAQTSGRPAPVVLLAPACSPADQFTDVAARGDAFRALVEALPPPEGAAA